MARGFPVNPENTDAQGGARHNVWTFLRSEPTFVQCGSYGYYTIDLSIASHKLGLRDGMCSDTLGHTKDGFYYA